MVRALARPAKSDADSTAACSCAGRKPIGSGRISAAHVFVGGRTLDRRASADGLTTIGSEVRSVLPDND
ncbi:hypothetical protein BRD01_02460 [Halobacteriales archaeon QS_8_65_32]|nr:MAG: hypothetical protein BRD01_02460 [Halobacteriales archaeon QS_8_65_32]